MTTIRRLRRLAAVVCLAVAPFTVPAAEVPPKASVLDPAYTVDLRAYLNSLHFFERSIEAVKAMPTATHAAERDMLEAYAANMTADEYYANMLPMFAKYIPPEHAVTLGAMARKQAVPQASQQAALQSFSAMLARSGQDVRKVSFQMAAEFFGRLQQKAFAAMRQGFFDLEAHRDANYTVQVSKIGVPYLDRIVWISVNGAARQRNAGLTAQNECKAAGIPDTTRAANLLAPDGITAARKAIDACEHALETMEKACDTAFNETREGFLALDIGNKTGFNEHMDKAARSYYAFMLKNGELNRQALQVQRRMISLVEAKRNHIQLENGHLAFDARDDLTEFKRMGLELEATQKELDELVDAQRQQGLRAIGFQDPGTPRNQGTTN